MSSAMMVVMKESWTALGYHLRTGYVTQPPAVAPGPAPHPAGRLPTRGKADLLRCHSLEGNRATACT